MYLCAAPLGALVDRWGPRAGSLISALLSALGYFSFAAVLSAGPEAATEQTYLALAACYFAIGAATVGSYFAALTTASLSFPSHPTLSLSLPLSLIGLSSLFLSSFSNLPVFIDSEDGEIDATKYIAFLGCLAVSVNLFGSVFMRVTLPESIFADSDSESDYDSDDSEADHYTAGLSSIADLSQSLHLDEHTPLLIGGPEAAREDLEAELAGKDVHRWTVVGLLHNEGFWAFGLIIAGCIGPSETLMASIGSVASSLLPPDSRAVFVDVIKAFASWSPSATVSTALKDSSALAIRNKHLFIVSIASTVARLITGFTADWLAPAPIAVPAAPSDDPNAPSHYFVQRDPVRLRRSVFCALCAAFLAICFAYNAAFLEEESQLWILSGGVGLLYGAIFTLTPAIVSTHFGATNFGLAWGMVSYFPALGTAIFSYTYAFLAETSPVPGTDIDTLAIVDPSQCYGRLCFSKSLTVAAIGSSIAAVGLFIIGKRWKV